jgi:cytochrome c-type biogenesis protein CcmE
MSQSSEALRTAGADGRDNRKFLVGGAVVILTIVGLVVWGLNRPGSTAFYLTTTELAGRGATEPGNEYRVNGNVVAGTLERRGLETSFKISDGTTQVTIRTDRPLPDAFRDDPATEVVAQGSFDGRTFDATQVFAKCPSKFKARA